MINTSHHNVHYFNQNIGKIPRSGVIDTETINPHDLCYQCYKHGPDCLFGKLSIKDFNDEAHFTNTFVLILSQIQMNMLFKTKYERKRRIRDRNIHKSTRITVGIHETIKKFTVTVQPKNACK